MKPILLDVAGVTFPAYMTFVLLGFIVAIWLSRREAETMGLRSEKVVDLGILMLVLGIAGARILAVLTDGMFMDFVHLCTDPKQVSAVDALVNHCTADAQCGYHYLCDTVTNTCYPPRDCFAAIKFWQGGLTYYGGFVLAVPGGWWYARKHDLGPMRMADLAAPFVMIGLFFGRIGCFFNGCCYGGPTDTWLGILFPPHRTRPNVPLHPTQLYEGAAVLAIAAVLYYVVRPRKRGEGEVFGWLLVMYGAWRFAVELLRVDPRGTLGPLSTSQLISIPLVALGAWFIWRVRRAAVR